MNKIIISFAFVGVVFLSSSAIALDKYRAITKDGEVAESKHVRVNISTIKEVIEESVTLADLLDRKTNIIHSIEDFQDQLDKLLIKIAMVKTEADKVVLKVGK